MKVKKGGSTTTPTPTGEEKDAPAADAAQTSPDAPAADAAQALVEVNDKLKKFFDAITDGTKNFDTNDFNIEINTNYSPLSDAIINDTKQEAIHAYLTKTEKNILVQYKTFLEAILKKPSQEG